MSPLRTVLIVAVSLVVLLGIVAAGYYASDGAVEATVTDKQCGSGGGGNGGFGILGGHNRVEVRTTFPLPGIKHTVTDINDQNCFLVQKDNHVRVHLRSERTSIWEFEGGPCVWDTQFGANGCDL